MAKNSLLRNKMQKREGTLNKVQEKTVLEKGQDVYVQKNNEYKPKRNTTKKNNNKFKEKLNKLGTNKDRDETFDFEYSAKIEPEGEPEAKSTKLTKEKELEIEYESESYRKEKKNKRINILRKALTVTLSFLCIYLVFLIYGVINTEYIYNDKGEIVPQKMTVERIKALAEFDKVSIQYRQARTLYEETLLLDYRIGAGLEKPMEIAPEYDALLNEKVENLIIQLNSVTVSSEYTQIIDKLSYWLATDLAVYCQSMSKAIQQNDAESGEKALLFKDALYNDFSQITEMILSLSERVEGSDVRDIATWSPSGYITESTGGTF